MNGQHGDKVLWILGILWVMALPVLGLSVSPSLLGDEPSGGHPPQLSDEYCGPIDTAQLLCPRTTAPRCVCFLGTRCSSAEHPPAYPRPPLVSRVPKPRQPVLLQLPQLEPQPFTGDYRPNVPVRPPRS